MKCGSGWKRLIRDRAEILSPYAVEIRYPGGGIEVMMEEAEEALAAAELVWDFVLDFLPREIHPESQSES